MNLTRKTLVYTLLISGVLLLFFVAYLLWLLPGLYVEHVNTRHMDVFQEHHLDFVEQGGYSGLRPENPMATFSVALPADRADQLTVFSAMFEAEVRLTDERLLAFVRELRGSLAEPSEGDEWNFAGDSWSGVQAILTEALDALPLEIEPAAYTPPVEVSQDQTFVNVRQLSERSYVVGVGVRIDNNDYMNLIAVTEQDTGHLLSWTSVITGSIEQILPVTLQSLPMIILVILGLVAIASYLFAHRIVRPIQQVSEHAGELIRADYADVPPLKLEARDEISQLAADLDALYRQLQDGYRDLRREHERQEVFLRASSHQLKTPLTASLLLVDGMIHQVGRYADVEANLPQVRAQLQQMQQTVQSILELQYRQAEAVEEPVDLRTLLGQMLLTRSALLKEKQLTVDLQGEWTPATDARLLEKILDSLLGNALDYTEVGGQIELRLDGGLTISNAPARIREEVLDQAMEPFVSSSMEAGRGLGLYIAKNYAAMLGLELALEYRGERVQVDLHRKHT